MQRTNQEAITYLVANYNNAAYVEDCLRSLQDQTCERWHCLICDDHSTDRSVEIIKRHTGPKIRLLQNPKNVGYIGTLKRLIAAAPTDIVGIVDSDDALTKDATANLLQAYAGGAAGFVYCDCVRTDENLRHETGYKPHPFTRLSRCSLLLFSSSYMRTFRKSVYAKTQGLDENMLYAEDKDLIYKLEEVSRPVYINKVLYKYRTLPDSQSHDPEKRKIGGCNASRAKRNALRRRNITGLRYMLYIRYWSAVDFLHRRLVSMRRR